MFSFIPFTIALLEPSSQKIVRLAERSSTTGEDPMGAGKDSQTSKTPSLHLTKPSGDFSGDRSGMMTPAAEFEPFEDSPFNDEEYEREKVKKILKEITFRNSVRVFAPLVAGVLGLWAVLE